MASSHPIGCIYALENPYIPSIYKIGGTDYRTPILLESPLVPVPFVIKCMVHVPNWESKLNLIYSLLKNGYIAKNFYKLDQDTLESIFVLMGSNDTMSGPFKLWENVSEVSEYEVPISSNSVASTTSIHTISSSAAEEWGTGPVQTEAGVRPYVWEDNDDNEEYDEVNEDNDDNEEYDEDDEDNDEDDDEDNYEDDEDNENETSLDEQDLENEYLLSLFEANKGLSQVRSDEYGDITNCLKSGYVIKHENPVAGTYWYGVYDSVNNIVRVTNDCPKYRRGGHVCPIQDFCIAHMVEGGGKCSVDENEWRTCTVFKPLNEKTIYFKNLGQLVKDYWAANQKKS